MGFWRDQKYEFKFAVTGTDEAIRDGGSLDPKRLRKAIRRAVQKMGRQAFNAGSRAIREDYTIPASDIKKAAQITVDFSDGGSAYLRVKGRRLPLGMFKPSQKKAGTSVRLRKQKGRQVVPHTFLIAGKEHVYIRAAADRVGGWQKGKRIIKALIGIPTSKSTRVGRYPLWRVYGPSIPSLFRSKHVEKIMRDLISTKGADILRHEISYEQSKEPADGGV